MGRKVRHRRSKTHLRGKSLISEEAARIMIEEGVYDFSLARRKVAQHYHLYDKSDWPDNSEIEAARVARINLFAPEAYKIRDKKLDYAEGGLLLLGRFSPRLCGPLVNRPVVHSTPIELHVFADTVEEVLSLLERNGILAISGEKLFRYKNRAEKRQPVLLFNIDSHEIEICVFKPGDRGEKPLSPEDQQPMKRLSLNQLRAKRPIRQPL